MNDISYRHTAILVSTFLIGSVVSVLACVKGPSSAGSCGSGSAATCYNGCVKTQCSTAKEVCQGPRTYVLCTPEEFTTTCQKTLYTKFEGINEYGMPYCFCGGIGYPAGTVNAQCSRVTQWIADCPG